MTGWLALLAGGLIGTAGRYLLSGVVQRYAGTGFPYGTLAVNLLGCLIIGFLASLAEQRTILTAEARLFWFVGFLGAFTTFSTYIYESWQFLRNGQLTLAVANLLGSILLGLLALWLGHLAASAIR